MSIYLWMFVVGGLSLVGLVWLGSADDGGPEGESSDGLLAGAAALLSVRGILAALSGAGAVGLLLTSGLRVRAGLAAAGAAVGALAGAWLWRRVMRTMVAFDRNHGVAPHVVLGREGVLTVGIAGPSAPGVVQLTLGGLSQEYTAVPEDGRPYAEGSRVVVVRLLSDTSVAVEASPYPAPSLSP